MIYDCFTFFNELDLLEIRLNTLYPVVDKFVLVEATRTHLNKKKPLYYKKNKKRFKKFEDKIIHIVVDKYPKKISRWTIENHQRNCITKGLKKCKDNDIIMISDLDEIPNPKYVANCKSYLKPGRITVFNLYIFGVYLNLWYPKSLWFNRMKILYYKDLKNILDNETVKHDDLVESVNKGTTPTKIRLYEGKKQNYVQNAGWHFTWLGDKNKTLEKMLAGSEGKTTATINEAENYRNYMLSRMKPVLINKHFPKHIVENQKTYKHIIQKPTYKYFPHILIFYKTRRKFYSAITHFICWFIPSRKLRKKIRSIKY